ncbi:MAG: ATP-dependent Clp protease ATP-binding subunit [Prevotella sp.]
MTNRFSPKVSEILAYSKEEAVRLTSVQVAPEHLLLGILKEKNNSLYEIFHHSNINIEAVKNELEEKICHDNLNHPLTTDSPVLNEMAGNILKLAVLEARIQHTQIVDVDHVILAILHDQTKNGAKEILESNNMNYKDTFDYIQQKNHIKNGIDITDDDEGMIFSDGKSDNRSSSQNTNTTTKTKGKTPILDNFSVDLTQAATEGKLDVVVGRDKEIQRVIEILCRRKKNNPILIGEPGVGKSAIAEGLAQLIAKHRTSPVLFNKRIVSLNMTAIVAGTKYRGQFEERIQALLKEIENNPDIIVFIDEIHTIIGAGSSPGSMDAANIMKPALARGVIQCIGATTLDEYRKSIEKDGALERRFQKVMIEPTTTEQTLTILHNIKDRYEQHHHVRYSDDVLNACVKLTDRYVTDRCFPDKAIDVLDEVGAKVRIKHAQIPPEILNKEKELKEIEQQKMLAVKEQDFEKAAGLRDIQNRLSLELKNLNDNWAVADDGQRENVTEEDVANVVSVMTGIPVQRVNEPESERLKNMGPKLKQSVIGQDDAINKIVRCIQRSRIGLQNHDRPIGVFMFLGPTGVGKTYLAKKLAERMFGSANSLIRIDMSEYSESFNTSRLVGAPPGYVGYDEGGQLSEKVRQHPYSIVLLDEIEKAHGNVFNLLLQVLDEGRLTDGNGRTVDFRNTIIIMTSNTGTKQLKDFGREIGFSNGSANAHTNKEYARSLINKSLSKQFAPEFLNRIDEIITFDQLDKDAIRQIIDIELNSLLKRIHDLGYQIEISDTAKDFIALKGYDVQFGARPLKRTIQNYIENELCELILSDTVKPETKIYIDKNTNEDKLSFRQ